MAAELRLLRGRYQEEVFVLGAARAELASRLDEERASKAEALLRARRGGAHAQEPHGVFVCAASRGRLWVWVWGVGHRGRCQARVCWLG